jgi:hypothetical protein
MSDIYDISFFSHSKPPIARPVRLEEYIITTTTTTLKTTGLVGGKVSLTTHYSLLTKTYGKK